MPCAVVPRLWWQLVSVFLGSGLMLFTALAGGWPGLGGSGAVQGHGLLRAGVGVVVADGPDVAGGGACHAEQVIAVGGAGVGAGHLRPAASSVYGDWVRTPAAFATNHM